MKEHTRPTPKHAAVHPRTMCPPGLSNFDNIEVEATHTYCLTPGRIFLIMRQDARGISMALYARLFVSGNLIGNLHQITHASTSGSAID